MPKVRTRLPNPPPQLVYGWSDPYQVFEVTEDGIVAGLTPEHPRYHILQLEWKLEVETDSTAQAAGDQKTLPDSATPEAASTTGEVAEKETPAAPLDVENESEATFDEPV